MHYHLKKTKKKRESGSSNAIIERFKPFYRPLLLSVILLKSQSILQNEMEFSKHNLEKVEAVFLVILGMSSFPPKHEVYGKTTEKFIPSWEHARTKHD